MHRARIELLDDILSQVGLIDLVPLVLEVLAQLDPATYQSRVKQADAQRAQVLALKDKLEEQQDLLRGNAKPVKGKWVAKEYRKGTFGQKADLIRKHVSGIVNGYLRENCRPLFEHLNDRNTLIYGVKNRYRPKPRVEWVVQLKGDKTGM